VPDILAKVGLAGREKEKVSHLSGGEQQRVAVARAIINKPMILYADEPTGDLDSQTSAELMDLFNQIHKEGATIIMATHDTGIVNRAAKRVITLSKGEIVSDSARGWRT
jgi:cell division transport system ATP-binding protein